MYGTSALFFPPVVCIERSLAFCFFPYAQALHIHSLKNSKGGQSPSHLVSLFGCTNFPVLCRSAAFPVFILLPFFFVSCPLAHTCTE